MLTWIAAGLDLCVNCGPAVDLGQTLEFSGLAVMLGRKEETVGEQALECTEFCSDGHESKCK